MSAFEKTEADRLRVILEALAYAQPGISLEDALPMIKKIEERTVELKSAELNARPKTWMLADEKPETVARFIDTQPDIQDLIRDTKTINAIKEVRSMVATPTPRGFLGLKEAKLGVEYWRDTRMLGKPPVTGVRATLPGYAEWIDTDSTTKDYILGGKKIDAIKHVRMMLGIGLKEAKDAVEMWERGGF